MGARWPQYCEPLCPYERVTEWDSEVLFAFTQIVTTYTEKDGPREYYVDPAKFHYTMLNFNVPAEERREALRLMTWLAHELSSPEPEDGEQPPIREQTRKPRNTRG